VGFSAVNSGGPASYVWDFGDGITATGQHNGHTYASGGTYAVWLTATNGCDTDVVSTTITVTPGPSASFVRYPVEDVTVSTTVHFTDTSSGGPVAWLWEFGDGFTSTLQYPAHVYTSVGVFTVTLTVTQTCGSDTVTSTVIVRSGGTSVVILALISDSPVARAQTMHFTATVSGTVPITYNWVFGDGTLPNIGTSLATASHVYASSGVYTVNLTTTNCCGSDSASLTVTVYTPKPYLLYVPLVIRDLPSHPPPSLVVADQ
jgi:PKD repeat protein